MCFSGWPDLTLHCRAMTDKHPSASSIESTTAEAIKEMRRLQSSKIPEWTLPAAPPGSSAFSSLTTSQLWLALTTAYAHRHQRHSRARPRVCVHGHELDVLWKSHVSPRNGFVSASSDTYDWARGPSPLEPGSLSAGDPSRLSGATWPSMVCALSLWMTHLRLFSLDGTHLALLKPVCTLRGTEQGPPT